MPQITPGRVTPEKDGAPKLYGVDKVENTKLFQERLFDLFKPHEYVTVKNIDSEPCYWQYLPDDNEQIEFSEGGIQKIVNRQQPEMWIINPGETEVLVGASAYRALDAMYKNYSAHQTLNKFKSPEKGHFNEAGQHVPKNFNFADGGAQEDFIAKAYLGKAMPTFSTAAPVGEQPVIDGAATFDQPTAQVPPAQPPQPTSPAPPSSETAYAEPDKSKKETVGAGKK